MANVANLLFLVHRLPFPPNKGDKVRSFHILEHLRKSHRVFVGTFVDSAEDLQHVPTLEGLSSGVCAVRLNSRAARLASLAGLITGKALSLHYYFDSTLARWVAETVAREAIDAIVVFSSSMAQYATAHPHIPMLVDFVDVDSAKWTDYAPNHRWPMSWLYALEGRRLLKYEREVAACAHRSFFATAKEAELFRRLAPECGATVEAMNNGVDANFFAPSADRASPFAPGDTPLVFTGAMDYWPNIDAVSWFTKDVLPRLRERHPTLRLHIVGRSPTGAVRALAGDAVEVTGTVPDVRPFLQHAAVVVAPLRLARGIQNKILEAMAMGRPVVAAADCVEALEAQPGSELLSATEVADYVDGIDGLLQAPDRAAAIGAAGRNRVLESYAWPAHLQALDKCLSSALAGARKPPAPRTAELLS